MEAAADDRKEKPVMAAFRDASWFSRPDTRSPKRAHVMITDEKAACGLQSVFSDPVLAEDIPMFQRCNRPGCRGKWAELK